MPLLLSFPIADWQFWATTAVFLLAGLWLLRGVLPLPLLRRKKRGRKRVTLTIEGRTPDR